MFSNIDDALNTLMKRTRSEHPQLYKFSECMKALNNPQNSLNIIHVGGTNGKGSTTNFIRSILEQEGYKVGTFTSPHLIKHQDRFRINGTFISDEKLLELINRSYPYWDQYDITMFEIDVLLATWYFIDEQVDYAIYEVGMGGTYDATNIVTPLASVITNISLDHTGYLGDTVEKIAVEKAGIIKDSGIVVTGERKESVLDIFREKANRDIYEVRAIDILGHVNRHLKMGYRGNVINLLSYASYQAKNAALAYEVCYQLNKNQLIKISKESILKGLSSTQWAGRFEIVSQQPLIILDGAHNEEGIHQLVMALQGLPRPIVSVFSALKDKDTDHMMQQLVSISDEVIVTEFKHPRAQSAALLSKDFECIIEKDYKKAVQLGLEKVGAGTLCITGSLYFISDVRPLFVKE